MSIEKPRSISEPVIDYNDLTPDQQIRVLLGMPIEPNPVRNMTPAERDALTWFHPSHIIPHAPTEDDIPRV